MKKIVFYDSNGEDIICFKEFKFSDHECFPYIFNCKMLIRFDIFSMESIIEASETDFYSVSQDLKKLLDKNKSKFYFYPTLNDLSYIIFEVINQDIINIEVKISTTYTNKLEFQYEVKRTQILDLVEQVDVIFSDINKPILNF